MPHNKKYIQLLAKSLLLSIGLTLVACGGGGGGGNTGPTGIAYTGKTNPSDVNNANTQTFSAAILDGSQDSQENFNGLAAGALATTAGSTQKNKQHAMLNTMIEHVKASIEINQTSGNPVATGFIPLATGNCGGTTTVSSSNNSTNYSITYNSYCSSLGGTSVTMNGSITASVTLDPSNNISAINISFTRFTMSFVDANGVTYTNEFSGSIAVNLTAAGELDNMTITVNFIENGKVYQLSNMTYVTSGTDIFISGKLYHPDYGYVMFTTDSADPFIMYNNQLCGGTLNITGETSNVSITVNADCTNYAYSGTNNNTGFSGNF